MKMASRVPVQGGVFLSFHHDAEPLDRKVRCSAGDQIVCYGFSLETYFCAAGRGR